jgi:hypothetical protein
MAENRPFEASDIVSVVCRSIIGANKDRRTLWTAFSGPLEALWSSSTTLRGARRGLGGPFRGVAEAITAPRQPSARKMRDTNTWAASGVEEGP